ncbi:MAG: Hsp70 family protein, partial [Chloroflexi bacterium]|nr:Hsp70 family protein [Chloroflexota bacterium]
GREQKITIQAGTGLSPEEIEQMKRDAEAHAEDDRQRREGVEVRNQADSLAYTAEKTMSEAGDKIPADVRADIDARVKEIRDALASDDASAETLKGATEALAEALQKAGSAVYGEGAEGAGVGAETATPGGEGEGGDEEDGAEEGTVEGEYREV